MSKRLRKFGNLGDCEILDEAMQLFMKLLVRKPETLAGAKAAYYQYFLWPRVEDPAVLERYYFQCEEFCRGNGIEIIYRFCNGTSHVTEKYKHYKLPRFFKQLGAEIIIIPSAHTVALMLREGALEFLQAVQEAGLRIISYEERDLVRQIDD
jgi:hypothetical protein